MRPYLLALVISSLFVQRLAAQQPLPTKAIATRYQLPGADCALFPAAMSSWDGTTQPKPTGSFTPTKQQVVLAESLLASHLHFLADTFSTIGYGYGCKEVLKNLPNYRRQYFGFYNSQHEPCLGINSFVANKFFEFLWLQQPIDVEDGGTDFWHIYFNLSTQRFFSFNYNSQG